MFEFFFIDKNMVLINLVLINFSHLQMILIKAFDEGYEVWGTFLDTSEAFDNVWHLGLAYKLQQNSISGNLLNFMADFWNNRKNRVVLND